MTSTAKALPKSPLTFTGEIPKDCEFLLSAEAIAFVADLLKKFSPRRAELLEKRAVRQAEFDKGKKPDFLPETKSIREGEWTVAPIPKDLQICMTPQPDCEVTECKLSTNTQGAFVVAGTNVELNLMNSAQLFGAAIVHRVNLYNGSAVHFDEALLGKPMAGQPQWALVAQGR